MKNKRNTGLRAGVYQESSDQKSTLFDLLASILIFLAFAAIGYTVSGFSAMLWLNNTMFPVCALANTFPRNMYVYASCRPPETDKNAAVKNESDICPCSLCFILYSSVKCFGVMF